MRGLPFALLPASRPSSRPSSPPPDVDSSASDYEVPNRRGFAFADTTPGLLLPPHMSPASSSRSITPLPSRSATPCASRPTTPTFGSGFGSVYASTEDETEDDGPLLPRRARPTWWTSARPRSRRKRDPLYGVHGWRRIVMTVVRHPLFPTRISSILLALLLFALFALALTLLLMHILNPDKYQLPWRSYCSLAPAFPPKSSSSLQNPALEQLPPTGVFVGVMSMDSAFERRQLIRSTWASHPRSRGGASPEYGLNNTSRTVVRFILGQPRKEWERRIRLEQQAYNDLVILPIKENMNNGKTHAYFTWAHSNALVPPFAPLPEPEHQNYTVPAHSSSLIPPWYHLYDESDKIRRGPAPAKLAPHDPAPVVQQRVVKRDSAFSSKFPRHLTSPNLFPGHDHGHTVSNSWVRPDFVIKADDDSFVMLAELEARLRWELYEAKRDAELEKNPKTGGSTTSRSSTHSETNTARSDTETETETGAETSTTEAEPSSTLDFGKREYPEGMILKRDWSDSKGKSVMEGPLIYWGYLVKSRFMAGELYALSAPLVEYVATYPALKSMTSGAEDKQASPPLSTLLNLTNPAQVAAWMKAHPHAASVRWRSERCWVYDHPKAGTVYSHGFLFPSEAARVKYQTTHGLTPSEIIHLPTSYLVDDPVMSHSTVSRFGARYKVPGGFTNFTVPMEVEALVEGSPLSRLGTMAPPASQRNPSAPVVQDAPEPGLVGEPGWAEALKAYAAREGRKARYAGQSVGGTVVVHYIKRNEWFLEAALALLGEEAEDGGVGLR